MPPLEEAEELFVARAQAVDPSYVADDAVPEICARLEGLPLAIELAAARVKLLSTRAIADRLERSLDLLTAGRADVPTRQQTLRATIDWSYGLLDADEQGLFVRLAVFSGGASLEAIEEVCGGGLDALASLVDKSLLRSSGDRFTMLELLREYAAEIGVPLVVRRAHLAHYLALAESAQPNQLVAAERLDRLELEHANLRAALAFAVEQHDRESAVRLAAGLTAFWNIHGYLVEGRGVFEAVLALDGDAPLLALQQCENGLGIMLAELGEFDAAQDAFTRALELARELDDPVRVGTTLSNLCNLAQFRGDIAEARRLITAAIDSYSGAEQERNHVIAMSNLGSIEFRDGDLVEADRVFRIALTLAREIHERREEAQALRWLARVRLDLGAVDEARALLEESIPATDEVGDRHGVADSLEIVAAVAAAAGSPIEAARLLGAAEAVRTSIGAHRVPDTSEWYERTRAHVEELAGADVFDTEYRLGLKLSPDEALGLVRELVVPPIA